jgi:hypothetical protein
MGNTQKKMFRADVVATKFSGFGSGEFPGVFHAVSKSIFHNNSSFSSEFLNLLVYTIKNLCDKAGKPAEFLKS